MMSGIMGRLTRVAVLSTLIGAGAAAAVPALAQATTITEFSSGLNNAPGSITAGPDGNLWFTEMDAIGRITPSGTITEFGAAAGLKVGSQPNEITLGPDGNLWFSAAGPTPGIGRVTPSGVITEFGVAAGLNPGSAPSNIVPGPDGNLWFIDNGTTTAIGQITPSGTITEFGASAGLNSGSQPNAITAGPDGDLWFTDQGSVTAAIGQVTPAGVIKEFDTGPVPMSLPDDIAAGADGNVWFTEDGSPTEIGKVTPNGTITDYGATPGDLLNPGSQPDSLTAGPDGNIWFADQSSAQRAIGRITPAGTITEYHNGLSTGIPENIAVGADGNLWTEQSMPGGIARITPAGVITEFTAGLNAGAGADNDELVPGPDGNLWFTDKGTTPAIGKVALDLPPTATTGTASTVTASTATVAGSVTPLGAPTTVAFDYGTTKALGSAVTTTTLAASLRSSPVVAGLSGLPARTVIYYRVAATNASGTATGATQTFTTAAATVSPPPPPPPALRPQSTTAKIGDQQITLTSPSAQACTAKAKTLSVTLSSTAIPKSHATKLHFVSAAFYLDRGVRHRRKKTTHPKHAKKKTVTVYTANAVAHHVPVTLGLRLTGLSSRSHTLKVTLSYRKTVTKDGHKKTTTVTKSLTAKFRVC
jgi:streptogramin lyase